MNESQQQKQIALSLAQTAIEVNAKVSAMSVTYDELMKELVHYKNELEILNKKYSELMEKEKQTKQLDKPKEIKD